MIDILSFRVDHRPFVIYYCNASRYTVDSPPTFKAQPLTDRDTAVLVLHNKSYRHLFVEPILIGDSIT